MRAVLLAIATVTTFAGRRSANRNAHSGGALLLVSTAPGTVDQQGAEIPVPTLGDSEHANPPPGSAVARHETEPGSKLAAGPEGGRITHRGHHGRRAQDPDAGDLCDLPAGGIAAICHSLIRRSITPISLSSSATRAHCSRRVSMTIAGSRSETHSRAAGMSRLIPARPFGMTSSYSVNRPRRPLIWAVRNFTSCWRMRCSARIACYSSLLIATVLVPGCCTAVQIARASCASFLLPPTKSRTIFAGRRRTS